MIYKNDDILNFENISCGLGTSYIGKNIIHFHTIDSTNNYAKSIANNASEGTIVISEEQSSGRGRLGKKWTSKAYEGIWMSLILKPRIPLNELSFLTILTSVSIAKVLDNLNVKVGIKWPNDIILNSKKLCGILTELCLDLENKNSVVIGIGINVKSLDFDDDINKIATSLYKEGYILERRDIVREFLIEFEKNYTNYINTGNKINIIDLYKQYSVILNKNIFIVNNNEKELVKCINIDLDGNLVIKDLNDNIKSISTGEISIRGENGYI